MEKTTRKSKHDELETPMLTDMYQLSMARVYFQEGRHNETSVFELFFRKCPFGGQYLVFAGVAEVINFIENF